MGKNRKVPLIICAVLIVAALGIAIPRFVSKPKGESSEVKEISPGQTSTLPDGAEAEMSQAGAGTAAALPGSMAAAGGGGGPESGHELGRNPFRELIRPTITGEISPGGDSGGPLGPKPGAGSLWPGPITTIEPFSPSGLPDIGGFGGDGQAGSPHPAYTLTGVVSGECPVAVLRSSDTRNYVSPGDVLADGSRVASVYRDRVVLNRPDGQVVLVLGGSSNDG